MNEIKNNYPEYIMKKLRQRLNLEPNDTSRDEELNALSSREVFEECCNWEGLIGYSVPLLNWIQDCFHFKIESFEFGLKHFCQQEAKFRLDESGKEYEELDVERLSRILYDKSEEWIDSDRIYSLVMDYCKENDLKEEQ